MSFSNDVVAIEAVTMWSQTEREKNENKLPAVYVHLMIMMMIGVQSDDQEGFTKCSGFN